MNIPANATAIKHQKYNVFLSKLFNLIIDLNEEQQQLLLKEIEEKLLKEKGIVTHVNSLGLGIKYKDITTVNRRF